jgi:putative intracellular protease/amidase
MAHEALEGMNIAILVTDGFEQVELIRPRKTLEEAGVTTNVVSPKVCAQLQFSRATAGEPAAIR